VCPGHDPTPSVQAGRWVHERHPRYEPRRTAPGSTRFHRATEREFHLMLWDGTRWVREDELQAAPRPPRHRSISDWLTTGLIVLLLPALLLPYLVTSAASPVLTVKGRAIAGESIRVSGRDFSRGVYQLTWDGDPAGMPVVRPVGRGVFTER